MTVSLRTTEPKPQMPPPGYLPQATNGFRIDEAELPAFNARKAQIGGPAAVKEFQASGKLTPATIPGDPLAPALAAAYEAAPAEYRDTMLANALANVLAMKDEPKVASGPEPTYTADEIQGARINLAEHEAANRRGAMSPFNMDAVAEMRRVVASPDARVVPMADAGGRLIEIKLAADHQARLRGEAGMSASDRAALQGVLARSTPKAVAPAVAKVSMADRKAELAAMAKGMTAR